MAAFGLVHGAWAGAWVWDALVDQLRHLGHKAVAADLPVEDTEAGIAEYAAAVEEVLGRVDRDVVLVGHGLGGLVLPLVAEHRVVHGLVFLCGLLPAPGKPLEVEADTFSPGWHDLAAKRVRHDDGTTSWPPDAAIEAFFHDLRPKEAAEAARKLRRQAPKPAGEPNPMTALPTVPAAYVLCLDDRQINPAWARRVSRNRLGVDPIELPGGHMPMLSDTDVMADLLDQMAAGLAQVR